jgi:protein-tyrosine phosphatase
MAKLRVLMVCMGNICRSPTAEGVLRHLLREAELDGQVEVDSAGTHDYHVGAPPDRRAQQHAHRRGYDLSALRARQVTAADFERFDHVLAMDEDNLERLERICPAHRRERLQLLMHFAGDPARTVVPDPYYGGPEGFEEVLDLVEQACGGLVEHLRHQLAR